MAKLMPVFLLAVFLIVVVASFTSGTIRKFFTGSGTPVSNELPPDQPEVKQYWMVFLQKGSYMEQDAVSASLIEESHMANIRRLSGEGKLLAAGPFLNNESDSLRGVFILDCKDSLEVVSLMQSDTAIATGRLRYSIRPWRTVKNCLFK